MGRVLATRPGWRLSEPRHHAITTSRSRPVPRVSAPMELPGIGELTEIHDCWRLTYDSCGHVQELARVGLEEIARLEAYIRREFAECLSCQLEARLHSLDEIA